MNILPLLSVLSLLVALAASPLAAAELDLNNPPPEYRWRVGASLSVGFNASASFSRLTPVLFPQPPPKFLTIDPNLQPNYDDGYGLVDYANNGINTIYWGYFDKTANQNIVGNGLTLHKTSINQPAYALDAGNEPRPGFELNLSRDLGPLWRGRWGLEGVFGFLRLSIHDIRTVTEAGTLMSDTFDLSDSAAQYFSGDYPADYQGVKGPAINVPFIPITPLAGTHTETPILVSVMGDRRFDVDVYFWRLGAYWELPLVKRLNLILDGGAVFAWIHSDFEYHETTILPFGGPIVDNGSGFKQGWQVGGYVGANLSYAVTERVSVVGGARFEKVGKYHQRSGAREAEFDLGSSVFFTVGATYAF